MQNTTLSAIRTQLGLKLSLLRLDALLSVFRAEKREPSEQELRTLDALLYDSIMTPSASSLTSFQTEDTDTAAIFSDLIAKSKDIRGKTPLPNLPLPCASPPRRWHARGSARPRRKARRESGCF